MLKVGLKGLFAHKRRLLGTISAVVIGVAFLAGTLVLGDTMRAGFATVFGQANDNVDVVVRGEAAAETEGFAVRGNVPLSLRPTLEGVDGVDVVDADINGLAQLRGADGKPIGGQGPPTLAGAWSDSVINPYRISEGRAPQAPGEVIINKGAADIGNLTVGSTTTIGVPDVLPVTIVGIAMFGDEDSLGGVTYTGFTFDQAQQLFIKNADQVSEFSIKADGGISQEELLQRIEPVLPAGSEAVTGDQRTKELQDDINEAFLGAFEIFLKIFSAIALIVAAFSIYNTFSVILAQRTRESALLRAIGASRRQILTAMAFEALVIGLIASAIGAVLGLGLAVLLKSGLDASGSGLPGGIAVKTNSLIISVVVGVIVTLLASVIPSIRASGIAPMAAMRDVAVDTAGTSRVRVLAGAVIAALGVATVLLGAFTSSESALSYVGVGALLCLIAMVVLGPLAAKPGASIIGRVIQRVRGSSGRLARENAERNPKRTASTASALMVGIAIVALATIFASSLKASFDSLLGESFSGDLVIQSNNFTGVGFSPELATEVAALPEVAHAAGATTGIASIDGKTAPFTASDPAQFGAIVDPTLLEGTITGLGPDQIAIAQDTATSNGWTLGQQLPVSYITDGTTGTVTVGAIYERPELVGQNVFVPVATWAPHAPQLSDMALYISLAEGVSIADGKTAVKPLVDKFDAPDVQDRREYIASVSSQIDQFLAIIYVLLALSILIAVMGIANTLALSIYERTRELGLLRAVGQLRSQMRSMVRWESAIIAAFGTFGGIMLGIFLGWAAMRGFRTSQGFGDFAPPVGQLVFILIIGGLFGVLAGVLPARRAAKLNILDSIAADG